MLEAVADKLGIEVTDDDIREQLREQGEDDEDIEEFIDAGGADRVRDDLRMKKARRPHRRRGQADRPELAEARSELDAGQGRGAREHLDARQQGRSDGRAVRERRSLWTPSPARSERPDEPN